MVKNSTGGNKSKKQGRKFATPAEMPGQQKVRRAEEVGEMYAAITKIFGGTSCKIICIDGKTRDCIIRRKFNSAGGKRQNMLSIGTWVLVGLRDWEVRTNGDQKCDLLEVYSAGEKDRLKQIENNFNFKLLNIASDVSTSNNRGANIAEQSTKYEDNCDIVTFANTSVVEEDEDEDAPAPSGAAPAAIAPAGALSASSSSEEETNSSSEEEIEYKNVYDKGTPYDKAAPYDKVKKDNDWMIDVDDI